MSDKEKHDPEPPPPPAADNDVDSAADSGDDDEAKSEDLDGHRPALREIRSNTSRASSRRRRAESGATATGSLARRDTVLSRIRSRPAPTFTHPLAHVRTSEAELVGFEGPDDPYHPLNWATHRKASTTLLYGLVTMTATWASSAYSAGTGQIAREFGVGTQVATLGTTLYLFGFGLGPLLWAPLSEVYGRRVAVLAPMFVAVCFSFGSAAAKDLQTLMLTRFFGAFFASAPVTNTGGVLGDLYTPAWRGIAMAGYAMAVVGGPVLGPIVSAAVVEQPSLGWRWTEYLTGILQVVVLGAALVFIDESYPPKLLVYKARRLRHDTGNWALHAQFEEWDVGVGELAHKFLLRPLQLLCTPICFLMALYASFCYGILYMQLGAIPIVFGELRGWRPLVATLPFLSILAGAALGCGLNVYNQTLYNRAYHAAGDRAVPEKRLPPMMLGSLLFSAGQFLLGWTARPSVPWIAPCLGLAMLGAGFFTIFQAALNYLVDTFQAHAASAVAANTFLRSCFAGAFPLVVGPLYHNLGVGPGSSITAGFAALLIPVPFVFYRYGRRVRAKSKWSRNSVF
ncbi:Efflux pump bik6 [Metarhizium anisopliae]|nr:Efflux pump bik6 [Metarhizium anisopliae]